MARRADAGMTVIELLIAVSVIAVGIMTLLVMLPSAITSNQDSNDQDLARAAAQAKLAEIRANAANATTYNGKTFDVDGLTRAGDKTVPCMSVAVAAGPDSTCDVTISMEWLSASNRSGKRTWTLRSYVK